MNLITLLSVFKRSKKDRNHDWARFVMYQECDAYVEAMGPADIDTLEISGGSHWKKFPFKSFQQTHYPGFDICEDKLEQKFDLIIADQVFEQIARPWRAVKNVHDMLRPGGVFLIATPFMIKLHPYPEDCTRWSETGLRYFLEEGGFELNNITTGSWGNRDCVRGNFDQWAKLGRFGSLENEWKFPVNVWAFAQKTT
jgi:SAM-dependent methyltransferase